MSETNQSDPCCANFLARSIFISFEDLLGREELQHVLNQATLGFYKDHYPPQDLEKVFPLFNLKQLFSSLNFLYGERSSQGLILRAGRSWFNRLYHQQIPSLGLNTIDFITLPKKIKSQRSAQLLADYFTQFTDLKIQSKVEGPFVTWQLDCSSGINPLIVTSFIDLFQGFWQEALYWLSGGKTYVFDQQVQSSNKTSSAQILIPTSPID